MKALIMTICISCFLLQIPALAQSQQVRLKASEGYLTTKDTVRLFYKLIGEGKDTVVIIHGGPYNSGYLIPDLTPLAAHHTLLFYDQRGAGYSSVITDTAKLNIARYVEDLETIRRHFHIKKLTLFGHSAGGIIAGYYAMHHHDNIKSILLVNPVPAAAAWMSKFSFVNRLDSTSVLLLKQNKNKFNNAPSDSIKSCWDYYALVAREYFPTPVHARRLWGDVCNGLMANMLNPIRTYFFKSLGNWDVTAALRKVTAPVLIVAGNKDEIPYASFEQWKGSFSNAELLPIEGAGHFPHVDNPALFFSAVEAFLQDKKSSIGALPPVSSGVVLKGDHKGTEYQKARAFVIATEDNLVRLINHERWDSVAAVYADHATIFGPGSPPVSGKKGIAAFWHIASTRGMKSLELQLMDLEVSGERLIAYGKYVMRNKENEFLDIGKFIALYRKENGKWRLQTDIFNSSLETRSPIEIPDYLNLGN